MSVRVIIVNWNGRRWLDDCLEALRQQDRLADEIVVVDNGSTDGSADYLRTQHPTVQVVALDRNAGFAGGNNAGVEGARTTYLAFLNNDTRARPGWLAALVAAADEDPTVGLVTSCIVYRDAPDLIDSAGDGYLRAGGAFKHWHGGPLADAPRSREVFAACGGAFLIRRDLFEALGGFDEDFFMVYEDVDLSYRARLLGARVVYREHAVVEHVGSGTMGKTSTSAVYFGQRNLEWTWIKNSPAGLLWRSLLSHLAYDIAGGAGYARRGQFWPWMHGKLAAVAGLPRMLAKRRGIQRASVARPAALWALMDAKWVAIKTREKRYDFTASGRDPGVPP